MPLFFLIWRKFIHCPTATCHPSLFHLSLHRQRPSGPPAQLRDVWSNCLSIVGFACGLRVWACTCVHVCECRVRVTQAVLLLWYHLHFTEPPLGGTTAVFSASRHLFLAEISRDLWKDVDLVMSTTSTYPQTTVSPLAAKGCITHFKMIRAALLLWMQNILTETLLKPAAIGWFSTVRTITRSCCSKQVNKQESVTVTWFYMDSCVCCERNSQ